LAVEYCVRKYISQKKIEKVKKQAYEREDSLGSTLWKIRQQI
jgi:hypothetical protein